MSDAFKPLLAKLADGQTLDGDDAEAFFAACLRGEPTPAQVAAAVTAMRLRGETVGEITACARAMRRAAIHLDHPYEVIDVCGTGGDGLHTLNISTAVGFVAAGGGLKVAKHGNRAITSKSGTADVLAALGVNIDASLAQQRQALDTAGICFLFAQAHHGAMKHVSPIRQQLGFRTIFNLLGPLTNPAGARRQVVGVSAHRFVEPVAKALGALGAERAWSVHGAGMDELTTTGETEVAEWRDGAVRLFTITPEAVGLPRAALADITGGEPAYNAAALTALLDGARGPYRDIVLLNAAAAFLVADKVETLREGVDLAGAVLDDGRAKAALAGLVAATNSEAAA
ncbi:anthranilate phosphoribosyltransferase [Caulobacter sp. UNC279MFTsu5.1]|uniref:anthranilate phosphoribosyltransferase n=1 Tax=Caulobacter sp. UNC279MFTsu5.1 TaxID=1502775 RepID=UPI0008E7DD52|nr:anthranilate phosphoribosyltransferase [Caulobacter sp. UNC279MFTsu5.1]SFK12134.1 anthranilate phosphoribosyltransferase [Caulobacter sp. UNC279MFTsu5.1]